MLLQQLQPQDVKERNSESTGVGVGSEAVTLDREEAMERKEDKNLWLSLLVLCLVESGVR